MEAHEPRMIHASYDKDIDDLKPKMKLSGTNWGNTLFPKGNFQFMNYDKNKKYDLCGMFQYPLS